ncbi:MAG TPA: DinB family protein [Thermoanaerobaculia bacterium]|nr:DinB family protein [Thermoanaerobaculia bacterium]
MRDAETIHRRLLRFELWALETLARSVRDGEEELPLRSMKILGHLVGTHWLWLSRLGAPARNMEVWPELSAAQCVDEVADLEKAWSSFFEEPQRLDGRTEYRNSRGEEWVSATSDVLLHIAIHGSHHRGQIIATMRQMGRTPPYLDFIEATRRGWVE